MAIASPILRALEDPSLPGLVADGGLQTDLIFHHGADLPELAAFPLLDQGFGRELLTSYYEGYARVAKAAGAGLVLETPTWRANPQWSARVGYDVDETRRVNADAVAMLRERAARYADDVAVVLVSGVVGPREEGYLVVADPDPADARDYHATQIRALADAGADVVTALTMTTVAEAVGAAPG